MGRQSIQSLLRCAGTACPVGGDVEALKFSGQRCHQQVGFGWLIAVSRAHGDTYSLGDCPHVDRVVTARGSNSQRSIHDRFAATR
jgi:hypothetical protein